MEDLFLKLLSMSIPASILIGVVVLLRVLLRKSPKWIHCILWGLVAIRLVCPFSIESKFSLVPNADTVNTRLTGEQVLIQPNATYTAQPESNDVTEPKQQEQPKPKAEEKERTKQWSALGLISWVWLAGCITMVSYALISWFKVRRNVKLSVRMQENIFICDRIRSPFILGVIRPRIYLPSNMSEVQKENVIAHEKAHIKRLDYLWKPFGFFLLIVYWFNPLCWLAYILLCRDIELACDEKVIRDMDVDQKKIYSEVLLSFSTSEKVITACPLAFGEVGARQRIKAVLSYKKPGFWIIVAAVVLIVVTSVLFLTNPKRVDHLNEVPVDSNGKKGNVVAEYVPEEETSIKGGEADSISIVEEKELTMEVLLELYENDGLTLKVEEEGLEGFLAYENMKPFSGMRESLTGLYVCDLVYPHTFENGITSDRNYELQLSYWLPETAEEYGHTENEIDNIRLTEKESQDAVLLYAVDERFIVTKDLQGFLQRDYGVDQYLICDLPNDFTLGAFRKDITFCDGWLLEGEVEEPIYDEGTPEAWYCPGGIGRGETASEFFKFENGVLTDVSMMMNHTEQLGETEILEGCEVQAVLAEYEFDLFTASGWEEYLSQHPETEEDVLKSHYWYVFLGKEDSETFYVLFLNQEYFTKDDVVRMAQSVQFTDRAF